MNTFEEISERELLDSRVRCPACGSTDTAFILYGEPIFDEELERKVAAGKVVLGGCCISEADPDWICNKCKHEFGERLDAFKKMERVLKYKLKSVIYGAAVGDALGVPFEFMGRASFECTDMSSGGVHNRPAGTFSDDTSMMLATCKSIKECGKIDVGDMRTRFNAWLKHGEYTPDGIVFDVGNATATALDQGYGCDGERSNGNGSLMRIAPLAFTFATDNEIREVSSITHAHWISKEACIMFVQLLREVISGNRFIDKIKKYCPADKRFDFVRDIASQKIDRVSSGGYVIDTLGASIWCVLNTDNYKDCVLAAVNLGGDTDTTACVAGALAGAIYGYDDIPQEWIDKLRGKEIIDECLWL